MVSLIFKNNIFIKNPKNTLLNESIKLKGIIPKIIYIILKTACLIYIIIIITVLLIKNIYIYFPSKIIFIITIYIHIKIKIIMIYKIIIIILNFNQKFFDSIFIFMIINSIIYIIHQIKFKFIF